MATKNNELQRRLLHAEGLGDDQVARERERIEKALGGDKKAHLTVVALVARTHGKYTGVFVNQCLSGKNQREVKTILKDLSADYSAISGKSISASDLMTLANKADRLSPADKAWATRKGNGNGH